MAEKNWIPFSYKGSLHFVYSPVPHVIVSADRDGSSSMLHSTTYHPLHELKEKGLEVRGSAQAPRSKCGGGWPGGEAGGD